MTRWILLLCLGTLFSTSWLQGTSDVEENDEDIDYRDGFSDGIGNYLEIIKDQTADRLIDEQSNLDDEGPTLDAKATEMEVTNWTSRRAAGQKHGKQGIWNVIRREVKDMKKLLPNLASNISWMETDVKDMNTNYFRLIGDVRVINTELTMIKTLVTTIWRNITDTRKDHRKMNKMLRWILNNVTVVMDDVSKTAKHVTSLSDAHFAVTMKLENAINRMSDFTGISNKWDDMKSNLEGGADQVTGDTKMLSQIVVKMGRALIEIKDNINKLLPRVKDQQTIDGVTVVSNAIGDQAWTITTISREIENLSSNILQANRRLDDTWKLLTNLNNNIDKVEQTMITMSHSVTSVKEGVALVDAKVTMIGSNLVEIYTQVGDLGVNMTALGRQYEGISSTLQEMHQGFNRVDLNMGTVHNKIVTEVGSIKGDINEMKVQLNDMMGVVSDKCGTGGEGAVGIGGHTEGLIGEHPPGNPSPVKPISELKQRSSNPPYPGKHKPGFVPDPLRTQPPTLSPQNKVRMPNYAPMPPGYPPSQPTPYPPIYPPYYLPGVYPIWHPDSTGRPGSCGNYCKLPDAMKLPPGPKGPGLPIGYGSHFTGICACSCACKCDCPIIPRDAKHSKKSELKVFHWIMKRCQCICPCPCAPTPPFIEAPVPPPHLHPAGSGCNDKLLKDIASQVQGMHAGIEDFKKVTVAECSKTKLTMTQEFFKLLNDFGMEIGSMLDNKFHNFIGSTNITQTIKDVSEQLFEDSDRIVWSIEQIAAQVMQSVIVLVYRDSADKYLTSLQAMGLFPPTVNRTTARQPTEFMSKTKYKRYKPKSLGQRSRSPNREESLKLGKHQDKHTGGLRRPSSQSPNQDHLSKELVNPRWSPSLTENLTQNYNKLNLPESDSWDEGPSKRHHEGTIPKNITTAETNKTSEVALRILPHRTLDADGYNTRIMPDVSVDQLGYEVTTTENNMNAIGDPIDALTLNNMLKQWTDGIQPGRGRPFGRWPERNQNGLEVLRRSLTPNAPEISFIPPPAQPITLRRNAADVAGSKSDVSKDVGSEYQGRRVLPADEEHLMDDDQEAEEEEEEEEEEGEEQGEEEESINLWNNNQHVNH